MYIGRSGAILQKIYETRECLMAEDNEVSSPKITILSLSPKLGYWGEKQYKVKAEYHGARLVRRRPGN
jgi:hypothetical protein